jgi:hypothetical protein
MRAGLEANLCQSATTANPPTPICPGQRLGPRESSVVQLDNPPTPNAPADDTPRPLGTRLAASSRRVLRPLMPPHAAPCAARNPPCGPLATRLPAFTTRPAASSRRVLGGSPRILRSTEAPRGHSHQPPPSIHQHPAITDGTTSVACQEPPRHARPFRPGATTPTVRATQPPAQTEPEQPAQTASRATARSSRRMSQSIVIPSRCEAHPVHPSP